jgi:HSP20 family molecular chaperone IbpA
MFIFTQPRTTHFFRPYTHTPSIAYWLLQPDSSSSDEKDATAKTLAKPEASNEKRKRQQHTSISLADFDIYEEDGHFVLCTDLPGVKQSDLKVEFNDGALHIEGVRKKGTTAHKFSRKLAVDENAIDTANLVATLADGILTIKALKKEEADGPVKVTVSATRPPEDKAELNLELDLPGIKVDDLQVVLSKNGELCISGERKRGKTTRVKEAYMLNTRTVDTTKLEAYLADGVLCIRAPAREPSVAKMIAVNGEVPKKQLEEAPVSEEKKQD